MSKIKFRDIRLSPANRERLQQINAIIAEYQRLGLRLTLRQLYYQLVSRDVIPNRQTEYAKLSIVLKEGRMAGIVDWNAIEDRLRVAEKPSSWDKPADILDSAAKSYAKHRLEGQKNYLEVWVEKDALSGVLSEVTEPYHVPILVNRGYSSVTAIYDSYKRFREALEKGQNVTILYLGDYDPSGVDMIRDVYDRPREMLLAKAREIVTPEILTPKVKDELYESVGIPNEQRENYSAHKIYIYNNFKVVSIALTREQIDQYNPPPNPAKRTDPRAAKFIEQHGNQSWEVDALRPEVLNQILTDAIESRLDLDLYDSIIENEELERQQIKNLKTYLPDADTN